MRVMMVAVAAMLIGIPCAASAQSAPVKLAGDCKTDDELDAAVRDSRPVTRVDNVACNRLVFTPNGSITFVDIGGKTVIFAGIPGETGEDIDLKTVAIGNAAPVPAFGLCAIEKIATGRLLMCAATYQEQGKLVGLTAYVTGTEVR